MSFDWKAFTADLSEAANAVYEGPAVLHFGNLDEELSAARTATIVSPSGHLALIGCRGDDAASFLHGQLTSDIARLPVGQAQHSAWCSPKGRMLATFLVVRSDDGFVLQLAADLAPAILKRLQMFVLRAKVNLADLGSTLVPLGVSGPDAEAVLGKAGLPVPASELEVASAAGGFVVRLDASRFTLMLPADQVGALWGRLVAGGARPVGLAAWRWLDVQAGVPLVTAATKEEFVPQMANFEQIGGVSFQKGCYPGQEIVARTQYLGKVKRHLYRLRADHELAAGMVLLSPANPDLPSGMVVTGAPSPDGGFEALAVLQENAIGSEIRLGGSDGPVIGAVSPVGGASTQAAQ